MTIVNTLLLAIAGGSMDAYSYLFRGNVFANAQTGNILLIGVNLASGNTSDTFKYLCPVMSFAIGIFLSDILRIHFAKAKLHWKQYTLLLEIALLCFVSLLPQNANALANALTSLACAIQVESFRTVWGNTIATTMCIGNLRNIVHHYHENLYDKNAGHIGKARLYLITIVCFAAGAIFESFAIKTVGQLAILLTAVVLFISFHMLFICKYENEGETFIED